MDLSLLPLAFSLLLTAASRLLHPYSTDDKTSRLKVKRFSTARDTQRRSQSYTEEKREEVDRGDQGEKRGSQKERSNIPSNQFPKFSLLKHQWSLEHPKRFTALSREKKEEGEDKVTWGRKMRF